MIMNEESIFSSTLYRLSLQAHLFFRTIVPEPQHRRPITLSNAYILTLPFYPMLLMGYLARRPNTYLLRLCLAPLIIWIIIKTYYSHYWVQPSLNVYNWGMGLLALAMTARALEFAYLPQGILKRGEVRPGEMLTPAVSRKQGVHAPGDGSSLKRPASGLFPLWFQDSMEVLCAMRGMGWQFGEGLHVPEQTRPIERAAYLKATLRSWTINYIALDLLESFIKLTPNLHSPSGGSIFLHTLSPLPRYMVSTSVQFATGIAFIMGFGMVYDLLTLFCVGLLMHSPTSWPPLFDKPWATTSLHDFWAKRWHQILRQTFLVFGGFPGKRIAGDAGLVIGTFLASGLFHDLSMYCMGQGTSWVVVLFFLSQAFGMISERMWRKITGKRVGGWPGRVWTYLCVVGLGQPCIDTWHRRGLGGGLVIPPMLSPTRRIFPLFQRIFETVRKS
ncbi:hypothetical protein SISNIDRAFT_64471 [Sistotremastrum niveocremeum HHB9708]|uniref:Wax synthase domain-containing protein n=1 Tax=Sistotremastrum niveocremeum HHB9708 TaxID=1314777 RepID=A0A164UY53_9AGAM|nr:hypothetical protein SISNIDRAFT_64471 [Sistotremastrum niveocremeum HHB9708]